MKLMPLFYTLVLTGLDILLLWQSEVNSATQLMTLVGVAVVVALGLLMPINSFLVKIIVSAALFGGCSTLSTMNLLTGLLFSSLIIHVSALWCELERAVGQGGWQAQYRFIHRMRHHWLGGLSLYAGIFLCYCILSDRLLYTNAELLCLLIIAGFTTFLYMEANRLHNPKAFWVEVSAPLSATVHYWFILVIGGVLLLVLSWNFSSGAVDQLLEWRGMIDEEEADAPFYGTPRTQSGFQPGEMRLSSQVDITLSDKPVMLVSLEDPISSRRFRQLPLYIAAQDLIIYSKNSWRPLARNLKWYKDRDDNKVDGKILLHKRRMGNIRHTIYLLRKNSTFLFSLSGLHTVELPEVFKSAQGIWGIRGNSDGQLKRYTVESSYTNYEELKGRKLKVGQLKGEVYTELEESKLIQKISELTRLIVKPSDSKITKIDKIRAYLRSECGYSLKVENRRNKAPLDNFIFSEKKGHCVLFASAFTLMLRAEGIPAKIVKGYAGGELDREKRLFLLRSSNAHAWTEIYFEKYGWVICDPTPDDTGNIQQQESSIADFDEDDFATITKEALGESVKAVDGWTNFKRNVLIFLAILALASFFWQYIKVIPALSFFGNKRKKPTFKRPLFIQAFEQYCLRNEVVFNKSHTVREILALLAEKKHVDQEMLDLVNYYYEVSFQGYERSESKEKQWLRLLSK